MTDLISNDLVLRCDRLGRVQTPKDRRQEILDEYDRSGMTGRAFARHYGLKYQTFAAWLSKRRKLGQTCPVERVNLVEAVIEGGRERPMPSAVGIRVELPGGASVEMGNEAQAGLVASLIRNLAMVSC
jgi:hypothetical protein